MPRKNKTPALKIHLRDSQRRSRARRRELIEDLQRRLQEYEQHGVQATLAMQQAARSTARDNDRLRALLAHHGIPSDEVERFLLSGDVAGAGGRRRGGAPTLTNPAGSERHLPSGPPCPKQAQQSFPSPVETPSYPQGRSDVDSPTTANTAASIVIANDLTDAGQGKSNDNDGDGGSRVGCGGGGSDRSALVVERPLPRLPAAAPDSPVVGPAASLLEMPCSTAAAIIAGVQGHDDKAVALAALGCLETKDCVVKNLRVFDLIDMSP